MLRKIIRIIKAIFGGDPYEVDVKVEVDIGPVELLFIIAVIISILWMIIM